MAASAACESARDAGARHEAQRVPRLVPHEGRAPVAAERADRQRRHALEHVGLAEMRAERLSDLDQAPPAVCAGFLGARVLGALPLEDGPELHGGAREERHHVRVLGVDAPRTKNSSTR